MSLIFQELDTEDDLRFESLDSIVLDLSNLARAGLPPHLLVRKELKMVVHVVLDVRFLKTIVQMVLLLLKRLSSFLNCVQVFSLALILGVLVFFNCPAYGCFFTVVAFVLVSMVLVRHQLL